MRARRGARWRSSATTSTAPRSASWVATSDGWRWRRRPPARAAERLRSASPGRVTFVVGGELTLFMRGILPGRTLTGRVKNMMASGVIRSGAHNQPLNAVLARLEAAVRPVFGGPLTYASLPLEQVDWSRFDIVGVDHYRAKRIEERYVEML